MAKIVNLGLVFVFPVAWFAPLIRTSLLPQWEMPRWLGGKTLFAPDEITVVSGLQALWEADVFLAIAVTFFALVAPLLKCLGLALIQFGLLSPKAKSAVILMGRLAIGDISILALYIVIAKGIGVGRIEVAWGLYLFTGAVIAALLVSVTDRHVKLR